MRVSLCTYRLVWRCRRNLKVWWHAEPFVDEMLNDRWRALRKSPVSQTCCKHDIIGSMLSPCAPCHVWNNIFHVNKRFAYRLPCFVRSLCIIVFNDFLNAQRCQTNHLVIFFPLLPWISSSYSSHVASALAHFAAKRLTPQRHIGKAHKLGYQPSTIA